MTDFREEICASIAQSLVFIKKKQGLRTLKRNGTQQKVETMMVHKEDESVYNIHT